MTTAPRIGIDALLTPDNCALILIDHQPFQFAGMQSHDPGAILNNVVGLAKTARLFAVLTILTTVVQDRGGFLPAALQAVFSEHAPIDRTTINTWEDPRVVDAVATPSRRPDRPEALSCWCRGTVGIGCQRSASRGSQVTS